MAAGASFFRGLSGRGQPEKRIGEFACPSKRHGTNEEDCPRLDRTFRDLKARVCNPDIVSARQLVVCLRQSVEIRDNPVQRRSFY
jgi:hypothetical protein